MDLQIPRMTHPPNPKGSHQKFTMLFQPIFILNEITCSRVQARTPMKAIHVTYWVHYWTTIMS